MDRITHEHLQNLTIWVDTIFDSVNVKISQITQFWAIVISQEIQEKYLCMITFCYIFRTALC